MKAGLAPTGLTLALLALAAGPAEPQQPGTDVRVEARAPGLESGPDLVADREGPATTADSTPPAGAAPREASEADGRRAGAGRRQPGEGDDWARWGERLAGLAKLLAADVPVRSSVQDLRAENGWESVPGELSTVGNRMGDWQHSLPYVAGGALAGGAALGGLEGAGRGASLLAGVLAGSMASEALNRLVGRGRPIWGNGPWSFRPFSGHASFPSGHTAYAFSIAAGLDAITDSWVPAAAGYGLAGVTAYSRLYDDKHWVSDVVVGAVLSSAVSGAATRRAMRLLGVADREAAEGTDAAGEEARVSLLATPSTLGVRIRF